MNDGQLVKDKMQEFFFKHNFMFMQYNCLDRLFPTFRIKHNINEIFNIYKKVIIIYNYFTEKSREVKSTKGSQDQFCLQNIQSVPKDVFMKTSQSGPLFYLIVPRDVKLPNVPLLGELWVGNVGQKAVNVFI